MDKKIEKRLKEKFPDLDKDSTVEQMLGKLDGNDVINAYKDADGAWHYSMSGSGVRTPEQQKNTMADLLLFVSSPQ